MNRQEAYKFLAEYVDRNYNPDCDYDEFCRAMECINRLAPPTPDPDTGLVPCGCGGEPVIKQGKSRKYPFRVYCTMCFMKADKAKNEEDAKFFWNHGMGNFNT